jgi:hypothetical protein
LTVWVWVWGLKFSPTNLTKILLSTSFQERTIRQRILGLEYNILRSHRERGRVLVSILNID